MWDKVFYFSKWQCFCGFNIYDWSLPLSVRKGIEGFGVTVLCLYIDIDAAPCPENSHALSLERMWYTKMKERRP